MRIGFFGAAGEVTGSCTLVETGDLRFLVDCGMFQGGREARIVARPERECVDGRRALSVSRDRGGRRPLPRRQPVTPPAA